MKQPTVEQLLDIYQDICLWLDDQMIFAEEQAAENRDDIITYAESEASWRAFRLSRQFIKDAFEPFS